MPDHFQISENSLTDPFQTIVVLLTDPAVSWKFTKLMSFSRQKFRYGIPMILMLIFLFLLEGCWDGQEIPLVDLSVPASNDEIQAVTSKLTDQHEEWRFGFDLRNGPKEDALQYRPLLKYLERRTHQRFSLVFSNSAGQLISDLSRGRLHFAAIGAASYLIARHGAPILPLVRGVNAEGEAGYRAVLVVHPGSSLHRLQDLKGKRLAFGSVASTQGYWIPRIMLHRVGLTLQDLESFYFTGSHRACAEAVITHQADACSLQDTLAYKLVASGRLRQLAVSDLFPSSGIFAHGSVPAQVRQGVRQALIAFDPQGKDRAGLYHWEATEMAGGFIAATEADYEPFRFWVEQLGLIGEFIHGAGAGP